jgi:hypothetical protein
MTATLTRTWNVEFEKSLIGGAKNLSKPHPTKEPNFRNSS